MPQATRTLLAVAAAVMTTAGCGWTEGHPDLITLEEARALPGPAPYWVGQEFEGLPLTAINKPPSVIVHYGECEYEGSEEEDYGCNSPLRIETRPIAGGPADWTSLSCRRVTVRGVAGAFFGNEPGFDLWLELYSDEQTISIVADSEARALRAARALRPVDAERASTEDLPPPAIDVEPGLASCG
jgi:hypothetical protein